MGSWPRANTEEEEQLSFTDASGPGRCINSCATDGFFKNCLMHTVKRESDGVEKIAFDSVGKLRSSVARDKFGQDKVILRDSVGIGYSSVSNTAPQLTDSPVTGNRPPVNNLPGRSRMSDGASDISEPTANSNSHTTHSLTDQEFLQVEMFFRSHKTEVHVCQCLANLYFANILEKNSGKQNWEFSATGIPLLLLDTGEHHRKRRLQLIVAEKGTGFVLFKDVIDHLTKYSAPHSNFHTLQVSTDHSKQAGLSFDDTAAAADFHSYLLSLINNPDDDLLNLSKNKKKKDSSKPKVKKYRPPKKTEISQPCCFLHVTKLERPPLSQLTDEVEEGTDKRSISSADTLDDLSS